MHFVYIIYSEKFNKYYKGYSLNLIKRLAQHNAGESRYTKNFTPWTLVFIQAFDSKTEALKREKAIKKYDHKQINALIDSHLNEINLLQ